jgi:hypothetical protein
MATSDKRGARQLMHANSLTGCFEIEKVIEKGMHWCQAGRQAAK